MAVLLIALFSSFWRTRRLIAFKRGFALLWSIFFGHRWFYEQKLALKLRAATLALAGLAIISIAT